MSEASNIELFRAGVGAIGAALDQGNLGASRVLAIGTIRTRGRGSGIETVSPAAGIATFRDGKLIHWKDYGSAELAIGAAGLSG